MQNEATALEGGFSNPVLNAQSVFRAVMDAMAKPATIVEVDAVVKPPAPLGRAAGAVACALIDADTPFWLDASLAEHAALRAWLAFHTGAREMATCGDVAFALVGAPLTMPPLERFAQGTQESPDRSATLMLQVPSLEGGMPLTFEGPGIRDRVTLAPRGLPQDFAAQWKANRKRFPRGVDLILTTGDAIACLPRSVRLVEMEG